MAKLLFWVVLGVLVYWLYKRHKRGGQPREAQAPAQQGPEDMVRCAECGVHLPRSESIMSQGEFFCSDEHRRQHQHQ